MMLAAIRLSGGGLILAAAVLLLVAAPAGAQSFNIDIDSPTSGPALGGGVPSPGFGAVANQQGFWTSYPATSNAVSLLDLFAGTPTNTTIQVTATSTTVAVIAFNNPNNTGDFALLFNDGSQIGTTAQGGTRTYTLQGLADGPYSVVTYTGRPQGTEGHLIVDVPGSNEGPIAAQGTPTGNTFTDGVTHVVHTLDVIGGSFHINLTDVPGAPAGYVGGFQITLIPEPASALASIVLAPLFLRRRRGAAR